MASNSLRVHSGRMRVAPGGRRHSEAVGETLTVDAVESTDVARLSFGRLIKVVAVGCGLFPLIGGRQSIDDGCLRQDLRDSVMGGPRCYVSGLVFAPVPSPMVKFC